MCIVFGQREAREVKAFVVVILTLHFNLYKKSYARMNSIDFLFHASKYKSNEDKMNIL
jgi:hypothetical protein